VRDIALEVDDASAFNETVKRGAEPVLNPNDR
jgi:hypothetical protein